MVEWLLEKVVLLLDNLLPGIGLSDEFLSRLDSSITTLIGILEGVGYFVPLDVYAICIGAIVSFKVSVLLYRVVQWVIGLIVNLIPGT